MQIRDLHTLCSISVTLTDIYLFIVMDKNQMVNELFWLLENNGETGCERIIQYKKLRLPFKVCMKNNLFNNNDENLIWDVFRSDTHSHVAVNNKAGLTVDWMDLDTNTCKKIFNIIKKVRSDDYNKLVQIHNNLQDVKGYLEEDMDAICDDEMREYAGNNLIKLNKAIQMMTELMKID